MDTFVAIATGKAQLQQNIDWRQLLDAEILQKIEKYCWAHYTEIEYVLVPFFVMNGAVTGNQTIVESGLAKEGRTNMYLLVNCCQRIKIHFMYVFCVIHFCYFRWLETQALVKHVDLNWQ